MNGIWLYDVILLIYALALLCFGADFLRRNGKAKRTGTGLVVLVWLLQTAFFFFRMAQTRYFPLMTWFETMFFFSWAVVTLTIVMHMLFRQEIVYILMNMLGFVLALAALFGDPSAAKVGGTRDLTHQLLVFHMTSGIASYAVFSVSALFSGIYLFLHGKLKGKQWSANLRRLPSLERTDTFAFRTAAAGSVLMLASMLLGLAWVLAEGNPALLRDPKTLSSLFMLGAYSSYLLLRLTMQTTSRRLAVWNLASCGIIAVHLAVSWLVSDYPDLAWR